MNICIPLSDLRNVLPFRGFGESRTYLDGILVEPHPEGGALLVATDGKILGAYHSKDAVATERRVLRIDAFLARALTPRVVPEDYDGIALGDFDPYYIESGDLTLINNRLSVIDTIGNEEHIQAGDAFINVKTKSGAEHFYPDWRNVVPPVSTLEPGTTAPYAAHYFAMIDRIRPGAGKSVILWRDNRPEKIAADRSVAVMQVSFIPGLLIVLMPTSDHQPTPWPTWMTAETAPTAPAESTEQQTA